MVVSEVRRRCRGSAPGAGTCCYLVRVARGGGRDISFAVGVGSREQVNTVSGCPQGFGCRLPFSARVFAATDTEAQSTANDRPGNGPDNLYMGRVIPDKRGK